MATFHYVYLNLLSFLEKLSLDENLSWNYHINAIRSKIYKNLGLLYRERQIKPNLH